MNTDLEAMRQILRDDSLHLVLALIDLVSVSPDKSTCRARVFILPEMRQIIATMSWAAVGASSGIYQMPAPGEMVIVGQAEGKEEQAFVVARLSSADELIPANAIAGDLVMKARAGQQAWLTSNTRINLSKSDGQPTENLVLGQQLKTVLSSFMQAFETHPHIGNMGYVTTAPQNAQTVTSARQQNVDNGGVLSNIAFTEKGS